MCTEKAREQLEYYNTHAFSCETFQLNDLFLKQMSPLTPHDTSTQWMQSQTHTHTQHEMCDQLVRWWDVAKSSTTLIFRQKRENLWFYPLISSKRWQQSSTAAGFSKEWCDEGSIMSARGAKQRKKKRKRPPVSMQKCLYQNVHDICSFTGTCSTAPLIHSEWLSLSVYFQGWTDIQSHKEEGEECEENEGDKKGPRTARWRHEVRRKRH